MPRTNKHSPSQPNTHREEAEETEEPFRRPRDTRIIEGSKDIEFADWRYWGDCSDWPRITFFEWKRIENPELYYKCEFNSAFNYVINYYAREAATQGISFSEFAAIAVTVAHFVNRAAKDYPNFETRKAQVHAGEPQEFRPVSLGEIVAVLATNIHDQDYSTLLHGIDTDTDGHLCVQGSNKYLPESDFKAHSSFLILTLAFLIETGILHVEVKSYPEDTDTIYFDSITPYDRRVSWFQELVHRYDVLLCDTHYTFSPQVGYSKLAYNTLVHHFRFATDSVGYSQLDTRVLNCQDWESVGEQSYDFDTQRYWCPAVYRASGLT
jgi:hypothetical protein